MSLSCPTASDCWATVAAGVEASTDGGHSWVAEALPPALVNTEGITCVAPSSCWALAETATAVVILARRPPS
jgi:hypothetical protein